MKQVLCVILLGKMLSVAKFSNYYHFGLQVIVYLKIYCRYPLSKYT